MLTLRELKGFRRKVFWQLLHCLVKAVNLDHFLSFSFRTLSIMEIWKPRSWGKISSAIQDEKRFQAFSRLGAAALCHAKIMIRFVREKKIIDCLSSALVNEMAQNKNKIGSNKLQFWNYKINLVCILICRVPVPREWLLSVAKPVDSSVNRTGPRPFKSCRFVD